MNSDKMKLIQQFIQLHSDCATIEIRAYDESDTIQGSKLVRIERGNDTVAK